MSLHRDLLEQARHLATREPKKPKQASLRRAVSAAYYAVFHLLVSEGARKLVAAQPPELRVQVRRAFAHGDMKGGSQFFAGSNIANANADGNLLHLLQLPLEPELVNVARAFVELQQARHDADYNHALTIGRVECLQRVSQAELAFADWHIVKNSPNANVFLAVLLFHKRWRS